MRTNRVCKICGKAYYYCVSCDEAQRGLKGYEPWHILVHDENCLRIFTTLQNHFTKEITDKEARNILKSCDLSVLENATKNVKEQVNAIVIKEVPIIKEILTEEISTEESSIDNNNEELDEEIKKPVRKPRAKKVNVEN